MNPSDDDLNGLLKAWTAPPSPASLEVRLRRAYGVRVYSRTTPRTRWIAGWLPLAGKLAGALAGAVVLLAVITRAFPQSLDLIAPDGAIIIDAEFLNYGDDGSPTVSEYRTSSLTLTSSFYGETILSSSFPGNPLRTAAVELLNPVEAIVGPRMHRMFDPWFEKPGRAKALEIGVAARIRNGCTPTNHWATPMTVIGKETVLNYTTTVSQYEFKDEKFTEWFAPALDCFSLRSTTEKARSDGAVQLTSERRVLKVTPNPSRRAAKEANR
jgi:hypothetical protein